MFLNRDLYRLVLFTYRLSCVIFDLKISPLPDLWLALWIYLNYPILVAHRSVARVFVKLAVVELKREVLFQHDKYNSRYF